MDKTNENLWVDLTDDEAEKAFDRGGNELCLKLRAVLYKLKEKNTPSVALQEKPVAWVNVIDSDNGPYDFHGLEKLPKGKHHLYNTPKIVPQGKPVAWVESLDNSHPRFVTNLKYCSAHEVENGQHLKYIPLYTTPPTVEAAIEATKEEFIEIVRTIGGKFAQEAEAAIRSIK